MAISVFTVQPTCEIHLLLDPATPMQVTAQDWTTSAALWGVAAAGFDPAFVTASAAGNKVTFTPKAVGSTIGRVSVTDFGVNPPVKHEALVRVSVHQRIEAFWIGNTHATVAQGENNYVLTVYAKFIDGIIGDVTSHPYLDFASPSPAKLTVDALGRLTGVSPTIAEVAVSVTHANSQGTESHWVPCAVSPPLTMQRPKLKRIHGAGTYSERRNILLLAEGFTASQEAEFDQVAGKVVSNLFDTAEHSPFNLLKHRFNVWTVFEASAEDGVTIGPPVLANGTPVPQRPRPANPCGSTTYTLNKLVSLVGMPDDASPATLQAALAAWGAALGADFEPARLDQELFDDWTAQKPVGRVQARDSFFGLQLGGILGSRSSSRSTLRPNQWFVPAVPARALSWGDRRVPADLNGAGIFDKYLASLRHTANAADPNFMASDAWKSGQPDQELAVFLVREDLSGGTNFGRLAFTLGGERGHSIKVVGDVVEHAPAVKLVDDGVQDDRPLVDIPNITGTLAHEAAHSFDLGDEYEGYDDPNHTLLAAGDAAGRQAVQAFDNLTHIHLVKDASNKLDVSKIKWNWQRVEKASTLKAAATMASGSIRVELRKGEGAAWEPARAAGRAVYLRHRELNTEKPSSPARTSVALTITKIAGDVLTLAGSVGAGHYPAGSVLLLPKVTSGNVELRLIDQSVFSYLVGTREAFGKKAQCATCNDRISYPDSAIPGLAYPRFRYQLVGVYEGGGTYNCGVYRSVGLCRMRKDRPRMKVDEFYFDAALGLFDWDYDKARHHEFGFAAKYMLVNRLDPEQLGVLDAEYPR